MRVVRAGVERGYPDSATHTSAKQCGASAGLNDADGTVRANWPCTSTSGNASAGPWIDLGGSPARNRVIFGTTGGDLDAFGLAP